MAVLLTPTAPSWECGIAMFGNAGCQYDNAEDVPLSANDRRVVADIVRQERALRCPR